MLQQSWDLLPVVKMRRDGNMDDDLSGGGLKAGAYMVDITGANL